MAGSYSDELGFRRKAIQNWPVTLIVLTTVLFGGSAVIVDAVGFPSVAGILTAYLVAILFLLVLFAILPVYALELLN